MLGDRARRRFAFEAEALARLQHPGIAQVLRTGRTTSGAMFLAMEFVDGLPLTEFARRSGLDLRARIELFCRVCDAVDHAHRRGVIHRDLKPSNVLVDSTGEPKVLDFGVARLLSPQPDDDAPATLTGEVLGTIPYMSPEQASGEVHDIDTRSDVYALGVLLYELLAGRHPYEVRQLPFVEALRHVREIAPPRLGTIDDGLRGDVERIADKALSKDRERRYASPEALAADLRRFLANEPILARPPSAAYNLRKFARRHRALFLGATAVLLTLAVGAIGTTWGWIATLRALAAQRTEAAKFESVARHADSMLGAVAQAVAQGADTELLREVLRSGSASLEAATAGQPEAELELHLMIGRTFADIGEYPEAESHLTRGFQLARQHLGDEDDPTLRAESLLGKLYLELGRTDEAATLLEHVHTVDRRAASPEARCRAATMLAELRRVQGNVEAALPLYHEAYALLPRLDERSPVALAALGNEAWTAMIEGDLETSERLHRESFALRNEVLGR